MHCIDLFILFAASAFRGLSSIYVFSYFPFGFEGRIWDLIVSVPDHCLSFYIGIGEEWYGIASGIISFRNNIVMILDSCPKSIFAPYPKNE